MVTPYTYGTLALLLTVGNYYRMHDRFMHSKETAIKEMESREAAIKKGKEEALFVRKNMRLVCYYYLEPTKIKGLQPENLTEAASSCTHLIVGYAKVDHFALAPRELEHWSEWQKVVALKDKNPNLKVLISLGAGSAGIMSSMVSAWLTRFRFIYSALDVLDEFNFDGLDFDWEFPSWNGIATDKSNFILLLKEFREHMKRLDKQYLLTAAVAALPKIINKAYDVPGMAKYLDFINLMSYDYNYFRPKWPYTAHASPLFPRPHENPGDTDANVVWSVEHWTVTGMPKKKITVGVSTYARTYRTFRPDQNEVKVRAKSPGLGNGVVAYPEVCDLLKQEGSMTLLDGFSMAPFACKGYDWMSYEDPYSLTVKAAWAKEAGCGGIMTFSLNTDDWAGYCDGSTKFPLHKAISRTLIKGY